LPQIDASYSGSILNRHDITEYRSRIARTITDDGRTRNIAGPVFIQLIGNYFLMREISHGFSVTRINGPVFRRQHSTRSRLRKAEEAVMSWLYLVSGILALAIFVYLVIALFYPEKF
jgi:K+-transporting ATPase KdpF subunit